MKGIGGKGVVAPLHKTFQWIGGSDWRNGVAGRDRAVGLARRRLLVVYALPFACLSASGDWAVACVRSRPASARV